MSTVITTTVLPDSTSNDTLTFGATGDSLAISGDSLNLNTLQDAGGNTIFVSDGSGTITSKNSGFPGAFNLISTQEASGSASVSFTTGIDDTYDVYVFKFIDINPDTNEASFRFQGSTDTGSSYGVTKTTTWFYALHTESGSSAVFSYSAGLDLQQSTSPQIIASTIGNDADACAVGELWLFDPSSTDYLKRFCATSNTYRADDETQNAFIGGYFTSSTAVIDAIQFTMSSGNFDGTIKLYGLTKS